MSVQLKTAAVAVASIVSSMAVAQESRLSNITVSGVLDGYYQNQDKILAERQQGFGLGETELAISGSVDDAFFGKLTTILESHDGETEVILEEAFVQTLALPSGFSMRAGRFMSDIGYLNNQHLHTDAFVDRPAVYRAFLGNHYFDDGIRLDYVAPTDLYWSMGIEAFKGDKLRAESESGEYDSVGVYTAYTKIGGDIGDSSSWQLGLSYLRNENGLQELHDDHDHEHEEHDHDEHEEGAHDEHEHEELAHEEHEHAEEEGHAHGEESHSHNAQFTGKNLYGADFVYKWAPQGNYKYQHLTLSGEYYRLTDIYTAEEAEHNVLANAQEHQGWYVSGVYQWSPKWSTGVRYGRVDTKLAEGEEFHKQYLTETDFEVAYHHSHFSTIRLQFSKLRGNEAFLPESDNVVTLQFIMALGAHNAHQF